MPEDGGTAGTNPDASIEDAGASTPDAGSEDAGAGDGGASDGGLPDAGGSVWQCSDGPDASVIIDAARSAEQFYWASLNAGFVVASGFSTQSEPASLHFLNASFEPVSDKILLPAPGGTGQFPRAFSMGDSALATWSTFDSDAGLETMRVARIALDGGFLFSPALDGGVPKTAEIALGLHGATTGASALINRNSSCILVVWNDGCAGYAWSGMTLNPDGTTRATPRGLVPFPFGGSCNSVGPSAFVTWGDAGFGSVVGPPNTPGTQRTALLTQFDCDLQTTGNQLWAIPDGGSFLSPQAVRRSTNGQDELWVILADTDSANAYRLAEDGGIDQQILTPSGEHAPFVRILSGAAESFAVRHVLRADGGYEIVAARPFGPERVLTSGSPYSASMPIALDVGDQLIAVGTTISAGDGGYLRRIQTFCEP